MGVARLLPANITYVIFFAATPLAGTQQQIPFTAMCA